MTGSRSLLENLRADTGRRYGPMALGAVVGTALASVHWIGFVVGGAAVGILATNLKRALALGVAYGLVVWLAFLGTLALDGVLGPALGTGQVLGLSAAIPVVTGALGSLARGVV